MRKGSACRSPERRRNILAPVLGGGEWIKNPRVGTADSEHQSLRLWGILAGVTNEKNSIVNFFLKVVVQYEMHGCQLSMLQKSKCNFLRE